MRPIDGDALKNQIRHMPRTINPDLVQYSLVKAIIADMPTLTPPNEPLTIEQLREMNETPIYVVTETYGSGWCILNWHGVNKSYTYFSRTGTPEGMTATPLSAKTYGDLWTAYRRPPDGL